MNPYDHIHQQLLERRDALCRRLANIHKKTVRSGTPLPSDFAEQAIERQNDEVLDALEMAGERELAQINRALARIEAGEYGICQECGQPIPEARLSALPFTEYCVACAEALSKAR
jgi:RNA polymerase-binding transcription factor DksA